jgi:hypothetical protein
MKIEIITGCTAFDTTIDGVSVVDMNLESTIDYILPKVKEGILDGTIQFNSLIEIFQSDDYEYGSTPCDQCGDTVSTTTWII